MKAVIRALIGLLALSVCLVVAAPSAAARTLPRRRGGCGDRGCRGDGPMANP